jgi:hypothetical protein
MPGGQSGNRHAIELALEEQLTEESGIRRSPNPHQSEAAIAKERCRSWACAVKHALTNPFGGLGPRSYAFGLDSHGLPAASLDEIEAYLMDGPPSEGHLKERQRD